MLQLFIRSDERNPKPARRPLSAGVGTFSPKDGRTAGATFTPVIGCGNIMKPMLLLKLNGS